MDAAERSPRVASTVHSMRTASRLTPAARPAHDSGFDAVRITSGPSAMPGKHEEEDGYHRREDGGGQQRDGIHGQSLKPRPGRVTADEAIGRRDEESLGSVRQRLAALPRERWILLGILGIVVVVHGWRALQPFFVRRRPSLPLGPDPHDPAGFVPARKGRTSGLPAYYPPGFHLILAGLASIPGLDVPSATTLLGIVWLPVIPLGAYLLARRLTGRGDVALVAAALTAFGGGLDARNDRLWVNSMFLVGQVAYPIYPRDLVFGILPFAILAFLRATDGERRRWVRLGARRRRAARHLRADPGPAPAPDPDRPRHARRGPRLARSEPLEGRDRRRSC